MADPTAGFAEPRRYVFDATDLHAFARSSACAGLLAFVRSLNGAARGLPQSAPVLVSPAALALLSLLDEAGSLVGECPPLPQAMRYGNRAFRTWAGRNSGRAVEGLRRVLDARRKPWNLRLVR